MAITAASDLPSYVKILLNGYSDEEDYGVLRSEMDGSIAKQRPRYTTPIVTHSATFHISSKADYLAFKAWMKNSINGGSDWWNYTDCITGLNKIGRFKEKIKWQPITSEQWQAQVVFRHWGRT